MSERGLIASLGGEGWQRPVFGNNAELLQEINVHAHVMDPDPAIRALCAGNRTCPFSSALVV